MIRVLLAEDDASVRDALGKLIDSEPTLQLVGAAVDAREAVELAAREQPDVAVVDVRMPAGGGVSAARGIRRCSPATRVLALSAQEDRATVFEMIEAGAVGYLVKGSSIDTIIESIALASTGRGSLSAAVTGDVIEELASQLNVRRREGERYRDQEARIRRALTETGFVTVVFQPICALSGGIVGVEALARFGSDGDPGRWFDDAAQVGLRDALELLAAGLAIEALAALPAGVFLSVNASPSVVEGESFAALLRDVDASRVVVEVTEDARIEDYRRFDDALDRLRALGARIAVDDAGAGFASLRHILELAPDFIKLDRTLIRGIEDNRSMQALAAGLTSFADRIGATIVAEGIERFPEIQALAALGVRYGQGYFFGMPSPLLSVAAARS